MGPIRATLYAGDDYARHANDTVLAIAMIETAPALDDLEQFLPPMGWTASMSARPISPQRWAAHRSWTRSSPRSWPRSSMSWPPPRKPGLWAGIHTGAPAYARRMHELGFDFISLASELAPAGAQSQESLAEIRGTAAPEGSARTY